MTWRAHLAGGIASLWLMQPLPGGIGTGDGANNIGLLAVCAGLGALLPDLDARESHLKRLTIGFGIAPFLLPSLLLHRALGHRGPLHSLAGLAAALILGVPALVCLGWQPALALLLGYGSHLFLDACTKTGVPLLWPNKKRRFVLPPRLRISTGSAGEELALAPLALAALLLLLSALHGATVGQPPHSTTPW